MKIRPKRLAIMPFAVAMACCGGDPDGSTEFVERAMSRPGVPLEPVPPIRLPDEFIYEAAGRASPFAPLAPAAGAPRQAGSGPGPDLEREREFLEHYSLDALRMVGSVRSDGGMFGLILTPEGLVHRLTAGDYLGRNHGRVTIVTEREVWLVELVADANGDFLQRPAAVALAD